jgi:hypothetical protein
MDKETPILAEFENKRTKDALHQLNQNGRLNSNPLKCRSARHHPAAVTLEL